MSARRDQRPGEGDGERLAEGDAGGLDAGHLAGQDEGQHHRKCEFRRQVGDSDRAGKELAVEKGRAGGGKERVWDASLSTHYPVAVDATIVIGSYAENQFPPTIGHDPCKSVTPQPLGRH